MAKKPKLTEGVLCRDSKAAGGEIVFLYAKAGGGIVNRQDVRKDKAGFWRSTTPRLIDGWRWVEVQWLGAGYSKSDIPRRGSAYECRLER